MNGEPSDNRSMVEMTSTSSANSIGDSGAPGDSPTPYSDMTEIERDNNEKNGGEMSPNTIRFVAGSGERVDSAEKGASPGITIINTVCNVVGGGVLALPSGFAYSSLIVGIFLLIGNACVTFMNLYFIIIVSEHLKMYDYGSVLHRGLGKNLATVALVALTIFPGGALISYARIIADAMPPVLIEFFGASGFITTTGCWILIGGVTFFALSCRRTLSELFISSIFGIATIMFAILCVVIRFFDGKYSETGEPASVENGFRPFYFSIDLFKTIPLITFSLSVHNNAPHYYQELQDRSPEKMMKVFGWAHVIIIISYLVMAIFGLLTFGEHHIGKAKGDVLEAYSDTDTLLNVCRLLMFIHFVAVYPILQMATRKGFNSLVFGVKWLSMRMIILETFCIVLVSCLIAFVTPNIDDVLAINGSVCGSIIILIVPSLLYLKVMPEQGWTKWKIGAVSSIFYGCVVLILGLVVSIESIVNRVPEDDDNNNNGNNMNNGTNVSRTTTAAAVLSSSSSNSNNNKNNNNNNNIFFQQTVGLGDEFIGMNARFRLKKQPKDERNPMRGFLYLE